MPEPIAIIVNDTHLHKNNIDQVKDIFRQVCEKADEIGVKTILHGGDFFTNRIGQPQSVLIAASEILDYLKDHSYNFYIIAGNHDKTDNDAKESYLDIFNDPANGINVLDDGLPQTQQLLNFDNLMVHFLPYFKENGYVYFNFLHEIDQNVSKIKNNVDRQKKHVLITHIGMDGATNNGSHKVQNQVKQSLFSNFDFVSVGHYHNKERINNRIHYTGSAYPQNFGEDNDKGGVILYDDASFEYFNLDFPYFLKYTYHPSAVTNKLLSELKKKTENNYVRVVLQGKQSEVKSFDKNILEEIGVDVKSEIEEVQQNIDNSENFTIHNVSSIQKEFSTFAENNEVPDNRLNLEQQYLKNM